MNIFEVIIVQPIFNLLLGLNSILPYADFGVAIIIFTIIIRLAMWPLIKKQLHNVVMMRKMQPELARIKVASKGNKQLEATQMMELYKRNGVNPFSSIGLLLIQLPIFIALYQVIQIFTLHRDNIAKFTYDFIEGFGPVARIIEDPTLFNEKLFGLVDLSHSVFSNGFNITLIIIAIIAAVTQYIMSKQTTPTTGKQVRLRDIFNDAAQGKQTDPSEMNAAVMGKMIKFLPFFMFFVMIGLPGALTLYYATTNVVAVLQQKRILDKDFKEMDKIADKPSAVKPGKKATAKAREKQASEAVVTRISAKDDRKGGK